MGYAGMLVGVDHSAYAFDAVAPASAVADAAAMPVRLFHAADDGESYGDYERQARRTGFPIEFTPAGPSPAARARALHQRSVIGDFLPVVTTHSRRVFTSSILGSTANELIVQATRPVMLFGPNHSTEVHRPSRVVCAVDGTEFSEIMVRRAATWSAAMQVPMWLVRSVNSDLDPALADEPNYLHDLAASLETSLGEVDWDVVHGRHPGRSIAEFANEQAGTLTVVTTHARRGLDRLRHGSVSAETVRRSTGPVLVYNPESPRG